MLCRHFTSEVELGGGVWKRKEERRARVDASAKVKGHMVPAFFPLQGIPVSSVSWNMCCNWFTVTDMKNGDQ